MVRHLDGNRVSWFVRLAIHAFILTAILLPLAELIRPHSRSNFPEFPRGPSITLLNDADFAVVQISEKEDPDAVVECHDTPDAGDAPIDPDRLPAISNERLLPWPILAVKIIPRDSISDAVQGVTETIKAKLEKGDLLVVWLMDESISFLEDRQTVSDKLEPFIKEREALDKRHHFQMFNAVFGFGDHSSELAKPTRMSMNITQAMRAAPIDTTGKENVMSAMQDVIGKYGKHWKGMIIVLWTDESGDDIVKLEKTIEFCKKARATVIVVGPTSVLGSDRGTHFWVDKPNGFPFRLPVTRGPETALPEKLLLPYWHEPEFPAPGQDGAQVAVGMPWYGGPNREMLLSGVSPWGLTRLALQTGGTFNLLDRKEDQGPFKLNKLKRYFPNYGSLDNYKHSLEDHPLRKAVSAAVQITYQNPDTSAPVMAFFVNRSERYPYPPVSRYLTPNDFRAQFVPALQVEIDRCKKDAIVVEQALAQFGKEGMEDEYEREQSLRWRAWYDLNRGRLLATSVRQQEYILTAQTLMRNLGALKADTNKIVFRASEKYKSGAPDEARAKEAYRLLTRCLKDNAETPWAYLAQWELDHLLGLSVEEIAIPPQRLDGAVEPPSAKITFPKL